MPFFSKSTSSVKSVGNSKPAVLPISDDVEKIVSALLDPVLVDPPVMYCSNGAIERQHAIAVWAWLARDIDVDITAQALAAISDNSSESSLVTLAIRVANLIATAIELAENDLEAARKIQIQLGGEDVYERLGQVENAFRNYQLISKAIVYGRAINGVREENSLKLALQTFPMDDPTVASLMMHAALGEIPNPIRLVSAVIELSDGQTQRAVTRAGFAPIIEGLIAHAQNQISVFTGPNTSFSDTDLICRSLERYHRLIRAISNITENDKSCTWAQMVSAIIRRMSELIEPRLLKVDSDIRQSLRKPRTGPDVIDSGLQFDALNGLYLLASVRVALDALALNSIVNRLWLDVGKALEVLIDRNLEAFRLNPGNDVVAKRLDAGINLAKIRFNPEYADIINRARDGASRRAAS